jgi:hypothetical protein
LASGTTLNAIAAASIGDGFIAILKADQEREFPLIFNRDELLNEDSKDLAPFVMAAETVLIGSLRFPRSSFRQQEPCGHSSQRSKDKSMRRGLLTAKPAGACLPGRPARKTNLEGWLAAFAGYPLAVWWKGRGFQATLAGILPNGRQSPLTTPATLILCSACKRRPVTQLI